MRISIAAIATLLIVSDAFADTWYYEAKRTTKVHEFGDVKIELVTDATKDQRWPLFELMIYKSGELQAKYRNVAFEQVFASDDNTYFLGVSNCGIPGTAYVVFDSEGKLLQEVKHNFSGLEYSAESVTLHRHWYKQENPRVEFKSERGRLQAIYINASEDREGRIDLMGSAARLPGYGIYRNGWPGLERQIFGGLERRIRQIHESENAINAESAKGGSDTRDVLTPFTP